MDYHCNKKFTTLQVHVQSRLLYNCHRAYPERLDLKWLEDNPGMLFHTDHMLADRRLMLDNKQCASCHFGCYKYEDQGITSQRLLNRNKKQEQKISNIYAPLKILQIMLSTDCNLACVYCSPEFSTSWQREISSGGEYSLGHDSIKNDKWSLLWSKVKQQKRSTSTKFFELLMKEIASAKELQQIQLLGGEPLLHNQLEDLIEAAHDKQIVVTTGLGVSTARLTNFVEKHKGLKIKFLISGESTDRFFEFIRYGGDWIDFSHKVDLIKRHHYEIEFSSTISNICLFDFHNFHKRFSGTGQIKFGMLNGNSYMYPHVMDDLSKEKCFEYLQTIHDKTYCGPLTKMLDQTASDDERNTLGSYLRQLSTRRKCSLDFLPEHFLRWCGAIA